MIPPNGAHGWFRALYPMAERAGPALTLAMLAALIISTWWTIGILRECVDRNRVLTERMLAQQDMHHAELMRYIHCPPQP